MQDFTSTPLSPGIVALVTFVICLGVIALFLFAQLFLELASRILGLVRWWMLFGGAIGITILVWASYVYWYKAGSLNAKSLRPPVCDEIFNEDGTVVEYRCPLTRTLLGTTVRGLRLWKPLAEISQELQDFVILLEDAKFYDHTGLDLEEIRNAIEEDVQDRKFSRGASTITQQLAKNLFLTKDKSMVRKATEIPLALRIEKELTKKQILELYLNTIEWGPELFGAEAAARTYFGHTAKEISTHEAILLALIIPNPKYLNPWVRPAALENLEQRATQFKKRLVREKKMTPEAARDVFDSFPAFLREWSAREKPYTPATKPKRQTR